MSETEHPTENTTAEEPVEVLASASAAEEKTMDIVLQNKEEDHKDDDAKDDDEGEGEDKGEENDKNDAENAEDAKDDDDYDEDEERDDEDDKENDDNQDDDNVEAAEGGPGLHGIDGTSIGAQITVMEEEHTAYSLCSRKVDGPKKFSRIRGFVQKLNEEFVAALYKAEQRHEVEMEKVQAMLETLTAQEQEHLLLVKQAGERIQELEREESNHKLQMKKAGETIHFMEQRVREMEAREVKVIDLAKKAAQKIKQLEGRDKKHTSYAKKAAENTQKLKKMLVDKHEELEGVSARALTELEVMALELSKANSNAAALQAALENAKKMYKEELRSRRAETAKIQSLRQTIEQHGGFGGDILSDVFSEISKPTVNLQKMYAAFNGETAEDLAEAVERIYEEIPESSLQHYKQVGFCLKKDTYVPVLALGPFDVAPGALRDEWLKHAANNMVGIYNYADDTYDMILTTEFVPYESGVERNLHILSADIIEKSHSSEGLSDDEAAYVSAIKKINMEARSAPEDRTHPQKAASVVFESDQAEDINNDGTNAIDVSTLKEKIIGGPFNKDELMADLDGVTNYETLQEELCTYETKALTIDVAVANAPQVETIDEMETFSCEGDRTITSLEKQMSNFMEEICEREQQNTRRFGIRPTSVSPWVAEAKEAIASAKAELPLDEEARDDTIIVSKPSYESMQGSSLVKDRLKMFSGNHSNRHISKPPVGGPIAQTKDSNSTSVMQIWKNKAAENSTPTHQNTANSASKKTFSFNAVSTNDDKAKANEFSTKEGKKSNGKKKKNIVAVPKNIQAKIDAGEPLTEHEKEIFEGIQKFLSKNSTTLKISHSTPGEVIAPTMSNVSAMTMDYQSVTAE